ncbi:MAG TPA: hypothetical protein VM597_07205 [Gemmataceae bacterium]|nr:hypothetical protein [Gemmataceae bacterium]
MSGVRAPGPSYMTTDLVGGLPAAPVPTITHAIEIGGVRYDLVQDRLRGRATLSAT